MIETLPVISATIAFDVNELPRDNKHRHTQYLKILHSQLTDLMLDSQIPRKPGLRDEMKTYVC